MTGRVNNQMLHITGCDDLGWSWKRVDMDGVTVAQGQSVLAKEAVLAASRVAEPAQLQSRRGRLKR